MANEGKMLYAPNGGMAYDPNTGSILFKGDDAPADPSADGAWHKCWFSSVMSASTSYKYSDYFLYASSLTAVTDPAEIVAENEDNVAALASDLSDTFITGTSIVRPFSSWSLRSPAISWESAGSNNLRTRSEIDYTLSAVQKLVGITTPTAYRTTWSAVASDLGFANTAALIDAVTFFKTRFDATFTRQVRYGTTQYSPEGCGDMDDGWAFFFGGNEVRLNAGRYFHPDDRVQLTTALSASGDTIADCGILAYVSIPAYVYSPPVAVQAGTSEFHNGATRYWAYDPSTSATGFFSSSSSYIWVE